MIFTFTMLLVPAEEYVCPALMTLGGLHASMVEAERSARFKGIARKDGSHDHT
jgi:hypothetical protein